jgi:hypothetical protein
MDDENSSPKDDISRYAQVSLGAESGQRISFAELKSFMDDCGQVTDVVNLFIIQLLFSSKSSLEFSTMYVFDFLFFTFYAFYLQSFTI